MNIDYRCPDTHVHIRFRGQNYQFPMTEDRTGMVKADLGGLRGWTKVYASSPDPIQARAILRARVRDAVDGTLFGFSE